MTIQEVMILGVNYAVHLDVDPKSDSGLDGLFGYTSMLGKKIVVGDVAKMPGWRDESASIRKKQKHCSIRHEVIHAYLMESGLWGSSMKANHWATNEEMIDWFAIQMPRICETFRALGALPKKEG